MRRAYQPKGAAIGKQFPRNNCFQFVRVTALIEPGFSRPAMNAEQFRVDENNRREKRWHLWGPYLADRQWGTVREDYSANGDAWNYFPHEHARSRAYRWGEDGIGGICDYKQRLCFALASGMSRIRF